MAQPLQKSLLTAEEMFQFPSDDSKYELIEGEVIRMPPTGARHGKVSMRLGRLLDEYVEAHDLGVICAAETGFVLQRTPDIVRAPDVGFVTKARIPETGEPETYWPFAPDLAVEVVSPSDRADDIQEKIREYFAAGTHVVWIVYPRNRTIFIYCSPHDVRALGETDELDGGDVLPGFTCPVRRCF